MKYRRPPEPGWEDRISRLCDHIKKMALLLPHERRTFAMLMSIAGMEHGFLDQLQRRFSQRLPPPEKMEDDVLADNLLGKYDKMLSADLKETPYLHRPDKEIVPTEEITESRMAQVACGIKYRRDDRRVNATLFLTKMKGGPVDFEFGEFPICPYSPGIRAHIDEGLRVGVFVRKQKGLRVVDSVLRSKINPKLIEAFSVTFPVVPKRKYNAAKSESLAAAVLFYINRGRWGPRMYREIMKQQTIACTHWEHMRVLVVKLIKFGFVDVSCIPAGLPPELIVPPKPGCMTNPVVISNTLRSWWMDVHAAILKSFRSNMDIAANGLWALWPHT